jgi:hypothetical protein
MSYAGDLALRYLADRKVASTEVAYPLGCSEPSPCGPAPHRLTIEARHHQTTFCFCHRANQCDQRIARSEPLHWKLGAAHIEIS